MMDTRLNWSSFIQLWSDQGGIVKFSWRDSQIRKAFLKSVNSISAIKPADRLPGSDLFNDDFSSPNHSDMTKQYEESLTETLFVDTNNMPKEDVPEEPIKNDDNEQSKDSKRDSWISMSDISFLESFTSKVSSKFDKKKTQQKSESFLDDFLDLKTKSPTSPVNNSRIDSVIAKIGRNSTNLSAKLGSLKSHVFGSNDTLVPIKKNSSSSSVKPPVSANLLDDSINDTIISEKTNEKKNSNGLHITPVKNEDTSNFGDMGLDSRPSNDLNQQSFFSNLNDHSSSIKNNTTSRVNTKLNDDDDLLNSEKMLDDTKNNSESVLVNNDNDLSDLGNQKQEDNWISSTGLSFLESFTNNMKPSSSNSRKSQQSSFFDFSEFDLDLSSNVQPVQPQKTPDDFLQSISQLIANDISNDKREKQENQQPNSASDASDSNSKQLYTSSMNGSSTSISSEFGEMVSANDMKNQNLNDDWMLNTSTNQDNWMSNSGLSFLETLKTSSNNSYHNNQKSKQIFGDLDEFILPLSNNSNNNDKIKKSNNQMLHELFY